MAVFDSNTARLWLLKERENLPFDTAWEELLLLGHLDFINILRPASLKS